MATIIRQSTAAVVRVGPAVNSTDGVTPTTTLALAAADQAEVLKAAGAATVDISGGTMAAVAGADGWYDLTLTAAYTNTIGDLSIIIQDASLCLPVFAKFQVVEETVYDALYAAGAVGYGGVGSGASATTIICQVSGLPIDGVEVWITTDAAGLNVVAGTLVSDALGEADFMLDPGTYYAWRQKSGYNFTNPTSITVS